jgi:uncharacterized membrane protein
LEKAMTDASSSSLPVKSGSSLGVVRSAIRTIRNRILAGIFLALPVIVTAAVILWLDKTIARPVLQFIAHQLMKLWQPTIEQAEVPGVVVSFLATFAAVLTILSAFFLLGMLFESRLHRMVDWLLMHVPGVGMIYSSVRDVVTSIRRAQATEMNFQRVVLIKFPNDTMRTPAFVTSSCVDAITGKVILCVYAPTTPLPTSGYFMVVPEEEVTDLNWTMQECLQAIISGGITAPPTINYFARPTDSNVTAKVQVIGNPETDLINSSAPPHP